LSAPDSAHCERWVEFHGEKWNFNSEKLNKRLKFRNIFFYDADHLARGKNGDVTVWIKEVTNNDKFYVGRGAPEQETTYNQIRIRCSAKKYLVLVDDGSDSEYTDTMSEDIVPGSYYDKLSSAVCKPQK
jgi:hypothetical protein